MTNPVSFNLTALADVIRSMDPSRDYQLMLSNGRLCGVAKKNILLPESGLPMHNSNFWIWHADYILTVDKWGLLNIRKCRTDTQEFRQKLLDAGFERVGEYYERIFTKADYECVWPASSYGLPCDQD